MKKRNPVAKYLKLNRPRFIPDKRDKEHMRRVNKEIIEINMEEGTPFWISKEANGLIKVSKGAFTTYLSKGDALELANALTELAMDIVYE